MKMFTLEFKSEVTYLLEVEAESREEAIRNFLDDKYDLNDAMESESDTDFEGVKIVRQWDYNEEEW